MTNNYFKNQKGFIAITTVLIILVIVLVVGISLGLRSIDEMKMALQKSQSLAAYYLANLCAEHGLMELKENRNYAGGESLNMENGSCTILPIEDSWIIKTSANSFNQVKKIKVVISQISPKMIVDSWTEVAEF